MALLRRRRRRGREGGDQGRGRRERKKTTRRGRANANRREEHQRPQTAFAPIVVPPSPTSKPTAKTERSGNNLAEAKSRRDERLQLRWEQRKRRLAKREQQQKLNRGGREEMTSPPRADDDRDHRRMQRLHKRALTPLAAARAAIHGAREDDIYDYGDGDDEMEQREWERVRLERQRIKEREKKRSVEAVAAAAAVAVAKDASKAEHDAELEWLKHAPAALDTQQIEQILQQYQRLNKKRDCGDREERKGRARPKTASVKAESRSSSRRKPKSQASNIERAAARVAYERERRKMVARLVRGGHFGPPAHAGFDLDNDPALGSLGRRRKRYNIISGSWQE